MVTQPRKFTKISLNGTHKVSCNSNYFSNGVHSTQIMPVDARPAVPPYGTGLSRGSLS